MYHSIQIDTILLQGYTFENPSNFCLSIFFNIPSEIFFFHSYAITLEASAIWQLMLWLNSHKIKFIKEFLFNRFKDFSIYFPIE